VTNVAWRNATEGRKEEQSEIQNYGRKRNYNANERGGGVIFKSTAIRSKNKKKLTFKQ